MRQSFGPNQPQRGTASASFHPDQEGSESGRPVKTGGRASRLLNPQVA